MFSLLSFHLGTAQGTSLISLFDWHYYFRGLTRGVMAFWHIHMSLDDCSSGAWFPLCGNGSIGALYGFA